MHFMIELLIETRAQDHDEFIANHGLYQSIIASYKNIIEQ